jgi:hypothetical protein
MRPYKLLLANPCLDPELRGMTSHLSRTLIPGPSEAKITLKPVIGNRVWAKQKPLRGEDGFLKSGSLSWSYIANSYGRPRLKCGIYWIV